MPLSDLVKKFITLRVSCLLCGKTSNHFVSSWLLTASIDCLLLPQSSKGLHTSKPNQNKAKPWSIDDPMRYSCTRATLVLHVSFSITQTSPLLCQCSLPCLHFTQLYMWWQITKGLHWVCGLGKFLSRMLREAEGQDEVRPLPILKGDILISLNLVAVL